jgi:sugar lactone lactonase YvrE
VRIQVLACLLLLTLAGCSSLPTGTPTEPDPGPAGVLTTPSVATAPAAPKPGGSPPAGRKEAPTPASPVIARDVTPTMPASPGDVLTPTLRAKSAPARLAGSLEVLAQDLAGPDDLVLAPDGSLYLTDATDGTLLRYVTGRAPEVMARGLSVPEGIAVLPGGSPTGGLIIAEQGKNRLVRYDPASGQIAPFLALHNKTGGAGVDGIALDSHDPANVSLLVPDSPNGTLLRVSLDGKTVREIARGFVRPVAAWAEPDGSILVADEFGNALKRVHPGGRVETIARLPQPDDVIVDSAGNIYVNCLVDGAVHKIAAATKVNTVLVSGLGEPQGIAFDAQGNLVVTDPGHHRLVSFALP